MNSKGIDLSDWQDSSDIPGHIDFAKMKAAGIDFVILRAAFGNTIDDDLAINYPAAKAAGLLVGLYHFAYYMNSPEVQAQLLYALLCHYPTDLPPSLDLEYYDGWGPRPSGANMAAWAARYVTALDALTGRKTVIYTNGDISHQMLVFGAPADLAILRAHDLWFAHVDATEPTPAEMYVWSECKLHQYTWHGDGKLYGVESLDVDVDEFHGDLNELKIWAGLEKPMGKWSTNARLKHYDDTMTVVPADLVDYDAAVVWLGRVAPDVKMSEVAATQMDVVVRQALKPVLGLMTWGFDYTHGISENPVTWPNETQDIVITKYLDDVIFMGDPALNKKRGYSGLIIDVSQTLQVPNTDPKKVIYLNNQWMRKFAFQHIAKIVWDRYKLPVFMYFTQSSYTQNPPGYNLDTTAEGLPAFFKSLLQPDALSMPVFATLGADGRPVDTASPIKDAAGKLLMDTGYWWLWLCSYKPLQWLYNGTKDQLYKTLNFTSGGSDPVTPPPPADLASLITAVSDLTVRVAKLETKLSNIGRDATG